ncbi:GNAT family N-acetyltransferase [Bacilli bacterium]|nr:hypothetical protein WH51_08950 [Bacilli bacterium VT-13-104]PZD87673.1 GNAT family N-acetyltransferase [Bacilli bacterium]PZD90712.1 GNAT family N-acetyltransferase [Bacilli bacterium]PZD91809.1 GNAT family N-acetyltransferase [Bacilli bacterium]RCO04784.1 GNAT family N-acetyltransferase [Bacilli bacterium]
METLIFHDIDMKHIAIINSWYSNLDSFQVEKMTKEFINYVVSNPNYDCWVISNNNELIGKVDIEIEEEKIYMSIIVCPNYRCKGYGKRIVQQIITKYENTAIKQIITGVYQTNEASKRLFLSVGFIPLTNVSDADGFINYVFNY